MREATIRSRISLFDSGAMMRQPHLKHMQIIRLSRILNMIYKPGELAEEIGVTQDTIYRSYLPAGMPHERDQAGSVWIHGPAFIAWAKQTVAKKKSQRIGLPPGQAWCMKCNKSVRLIKPTVKAVNRYIEILQSTCPFCHTIVNRARACSPRPAGEGIGVRGKA